jgi:hypothetical protein
MIKPTNKLSFFTLNAVIAALGQLGTSVCKRRSRMVVLFILALFSPATLQAQSAAVRVYGMVIQHRSDWRAFPHRHSLKDTRTQQTYWLEFERRDFPLLRPGTHVCVVGNPLVDRPNHLRVIGVTEGPEGCGERQ